MCTQKQWAAHEGSWTVHSAEEVWCPIGPFKGLPQYGNHNHAGSAGLALELRLGKGR